MKLLIVLISIVLPLMFATTEAFAQIEEQVCADPLDAFVDEKIEVQRGGLYMTSEGRDNAGSITTTVRLVINSAQERS